MKGPAPIFQRLFLELSQDDLAQGNAAHKLQVLTMLVRTISLLREQSHKLLRPAHCHSGRGKLLNVTAQARLWQVLPTLKMS